MASSSPESETIQSRWQAIHTECPDAVHLLAVSKGHPAIAVRELAALGQVDFGESRVQEALPKQQDLDDLSGLRWHFIGRLQANKVRAVVRAFSVIHSIDSQGLAERTSRIAVEENQNPEVFFQVKLRDDPAKGGWEPDALREVWPQLQSLPGLKPIGLMTMAPLGLGPKERQSLFHDCRTLADELSLPDCSMGMSGDWKQAAEAGATWVRVGSGLFGPRPERLV
ncbi:YggS family pyridoxal phosphate-dependent enzyme [Synechococcus sp. AH-601-N10]|nr:YggS family pyridoxal phosphate-dependent enzyme [Synechococcus sp. AH-601-N10]